MTVKQLIQAIKDGDSLLWNDPDPIEGNDYMVTEVLFINKWDSTALIQYNGGDSEAEVFISELVKT